MIWPAALKLRLPYVDSFTGGTTSCLLFLDLKDVIYALSNDYVANDLK